MMEMIVVLVIFMILFTMAVSSFSGLRATIALNESIKNLEQDIRNAQRDAMLLTRGANERWIYGVGVDFSRFPETGEYKVFKWCSQYDDFGHPKTTSDFPNFDPSDGNLGFANNGNMTTTYIENCTRGAIGFSGASGGLMEAKGKSIVSIQYPVVVGIDKQRYGNGGNPAFPAYLLFESATGNAFFYDSDGRLLNYTTDQKLRADRFDFQIVLATANMKHSRLLRVNRASGKIELDKVTPASLKSDWIFPYFSSTSDELPGTPQPAPAPGTKPPPDGKETPPVKTDDEKEDSKNNQPEGDKEGGDDDSVFIPSL